MRAGCRQTVGLSAATREGRRALKSPGVPILIVLPVAGFPLLSSIKVMAPVAVPVAYPATSVAVDVVPVVFGLAPAPVTVAVAGHTHTVVAVEIATLEGASGCGRGKERWQRQARGCCQERRHRTDGHRWPPLLHFVIDQRVPPAVVPPAPLPKLDLHAWLRFPGFGRTAATQDRAVESDQTYSSRRTMH